MKKGVLIWLPMVIVVVGLLMALLVPSVIAQELPSSNVTDESVVGVVYELDGGRVYIKAYDFKYDDLGEKYVVYADKAVYYGVSKEVYGIGYFLPGDVADGSVRDDLDYSEPKSLEERIEELEERVEALEGVK